MQSNSSTSGDARRLALHLIPAERTRAPRPEPRTPPTPPEDAEELVALRAQLAETRAKLEEAMEEVAFYREQLRSTQVFHDHLLQLERARHRVARRMIARDLAAVMAGLTRDAHALDAEAGGGAYSTDAMQQARSSDHDEGN
jgi:hypothetical protein